MSDRPHKKLKLWAAAMELVVNVYQLTKVFPKEEEFGLKSQLRRAAVSIPSNIAEGLTRASKGDKRHFLNIAQSSLSEVDAQLEICHRLGLIDDASLEKSEQLMREVYMLLSGLYRSIK
jgi:four helix bundle protein